jgi:predicted Zn-dependent protease
VGLFLHQAALLVAIGQPERARTALRRGLRVHPAASALAQELAAVEALLGRGSGR